jgi:signal peptidase I
MSTGIDPQPDASGQLAAGAGTAVAGEPDVAPASRDDLAPNGDAPSPGKRTRKGRGGFRETAVLLAVALVLALLIKAFLVQAFYIPSASMEPTLRDGDRVLVNELAYRSSTPRRFDVIVFRSPTEKGDSNPAASFWHWLTAGMGFGSGGRTDYIKRVIGLPGELVEIKSGVVYVDGDRLDEPYLSPVRDTNSYGPYRVPQGFLFVMGDNRTDSGDSRWLPDNGGLGYIPIDHVIGRAFVKVWPPSRIGWLRGVPSDASS